MRRDQLSESQRQVHQDRNAAQMRRVRLNESDNQCQVHQDRDAIVHSQNRFLNQTSSHNTGLFFSETLQNFRFILDPMTLCSHCNAKIFSCEPQGICCASGKIRLAETIAAPNLIELFTRQDSIGKEFRLNIRAYNNLFAFTSVRVTLDKNLANGRDGVYTFRVQGGIYHSIGSLLPTDNIPKFIQLYIYDTEHEIENRLTIMPHLSQEMIEMLKHTLDNLNPFVVNFHSISSNNNISEL